MNKRVKEFIEAVIEDINKDNWYFVFDYWYQTTEDDSWWNDTEDTKELFDVLKVFGKSFVNTEDIRKEIIENYVEEIVNYIQHSNYNKVSTWHIRWAEISARLRSSLGFSTSELFDIFNEIDMSGITPDYNNQRYEVIGL